MNATILKVIPRSFRAKGCLVTLTIFVRALLNFVGLAALLPVLYLILDIEAIHTNPIAQRVYDYFGFTSDTSFVVSKWGSVADGIYLPSGSIGRSV